MKGMLFLCMILFFMPLLSCNNTFKKEYHKSKNFQWKIAGRIPNNSHGTPSLGLAGPVAGISHDRLIIGGGSNFPNGAPWNGGNKVYYNEIYVFKKKEDSVINIKNGLHLPYPVAYSANCTTDKGIVVAGGENENGAINKVLLINWDTVKQSLVINYLPALPQPLSSGAIAGIHNDIYFAGGQNANAVSNKLYHLDLGHPEKGWDTLPDLPKPVTHTVLYTQSNGPDACLYLVGGRKRNPDSTSILYDEVYQFNLETRQWSQKSSLPYALSAHTGVSWNDSTLLVFSGDRGKTFHETEILLMKIARENDPDRKEQLIKEKNELQKSHPGFNGNVLSYNTHTDVWKKTDSIPFPGQVTTTALKWDGDVIIPCGEIRAGVRTPEIVMGIVSE